jgi:hypothetical protein
MSQMADGRRVACDGEGCVETAYLPVALRSELGQRMDPNMPTAENWLFVREKDSWEHFCPQCSHRRLRSLANR